MKKILTALVATSALGLAAPAFAAQDTTAPAPGAEAPAAAAATAKAGDTVYDSAGEVVATVESVDGSNAVLSTGASKATVPLSSLSSGPKGPTIGMTKSELEAAIAGAAAK